MSKSEENMRKRDVRRKVRCIHRVDRDPPLRCGHRAIERQGRGVLGCTSGRHQTIDHREDRVNAEAASLVSLSALTDATDAGSVPLRLGGVSDMSFFSLSLTLTSRRLLVDEEEVEPTSLKGGLAASSLAGGCVDGVRIGLDRASATGATMSS